MAVASAGSYASLPPRSRQITTPATTTQFFYRPDALPTPNQQRQSTEGSAFYTLRILPTTHYTSSTMYRLQNFHLIQALKLHQQKKYTFCKCLHSHSFKPVNCNIVGRVQSLQPPPRRLHWKTNWHVKALSCCRLTSTSAVSVIIPDTGTVDAVTATSGPGPASVCATIVIE